MSINKYDAKTQMTLVTSKKMEIQVRKLYLEVVLMNLDSDETSRDFDAAVLHKFRYLS